jgi:ribosome biogenesis GTPase
VRAAVDDGSLDARRFESWQKLEREIAALERRDDVRGGRRAARAMGRAVRRAAEVEPKFRRER